MDAVDEKWEPETLLLVEALQAHAGRDLDRYPARGAYCRAPMYSLHVFFPPGASLLQRGRLLFVLEFRLPLERCEIHAYTHVRCLVAEPLDLQLLEG